MPLQKVRMPEQTGTQEGKYKGGWFYLWSLKRDQQDHFDLLLAIFKDGINQ